MLESQQNKRKSKPWKTKQKKRRDETVAENGTEESAGHGIAGEPSEADKGRSGESIGRVRVRVRGRESIGSLWRNGSVLVLGLRIGRGRHRHSLLLSVLALDSKRRNVFEG